VYQRSYEVSSSFRKFIRVLSTKEIAKLDSFGGYLLNDRLSLKSFFLTIDCACAFRNFFPLGGRESVDIQPIGNLTVIPPLLTQFSDGDE